MPARLEKAMKDTAKPKTIPGQYAVYVSPAEERRRKAKEEQKQHYEQQQRMLAEQQRDAFPFATTGE